MTDATPDNNTAIDPNSPEYAQAMVAKFESRQEVPSDTQQTPPTEPRPEWLPEKFKTPEELARAYRELERKLGEKAPNQDPKDPATTTTQDEAREAVKNAGLDFTALSNKYATQGSIDEADYEALAKVGISRDLVDAYIAGQEAIAAKIVQDVYSTVGGEKNYRAMIEWASKNLTQEQIQAFDRLAENGTADEFKLAVEGLYARYTAANGRRPNLLYGGSQAISHGAFRSTAEVVAAMKDPRYQTDPAYQREVRDRLAVSNVF